MEPERAERVADRSRNRRDGRLAEPVHLGARALHELVGERLRQVGDRRDLVVGEVRVRHLAVGERDAFEQRGPEPHRHGALVLQLRAGPVDDPSGIHGGVRAHHLDAARLLVDAHLCGGCALVPVRGADALARVRVEPAVVRELPDAPPAVAAQIAHGLLERAAHHVRGAARRRAGVVGNEVGVGVGEADLGCRDAEELARHEAQRSARALTELGGRAAQRVPAVLVRLDCDLRPTRRLHALEQHAQPLPTAIFVPADRGRRTLEALREADVVHRLAGAEAVAVAQHVPQPELERIDAQPLGEHVQRPLGRPRGLRGPEASEGAGRWQVRVDAAGVDGDVRDAVRPDRRVADLDRDARTAVGVGARVDRGVDALGDERPVAAGADRHPEHRRMAVVRHPLLRRAATRCVPAGRPSGRARP